MIPYRAMLDVPAELLRYLSRLLAAERRRRGTRARSRKLTCQGQALLALRWFRDRTRPGRLADHGISRATAYRYIDEAADVLSAQAHGLDQALGRAMADGVPCVILDGKVFETDRLAETVTSKKGEEIGFHCSRSFLCARFVPVVAPWLLARRDPAIRPCQNGPPRRRIRRACARRIVRPAPHRSHPAARVAMSSDQPFASPGG